MTTLPNIYSLEQLEEFAAAPDLADLGEQDLAPGQVLAVFHRQAVPDHRGPGQAGDPPEPGRVPDRLGVPGQQRDPPAR